MADAPCGQSDCPIIEPHDIDRRYLRVQTLPAGTERYRVAPRQWGADVFAPAGVGNSRLSPLVDRRHTYVAEQRSAALLESALHEASGPNPRIYRAVLADFVVHRIQLQAPIHLVDLRDPALDTLGVQRFQLTGAGPLHYPCTRAVAHRQVGSKDTAGFVWTSRQGALHTERNPDGLAAEVLRHECLDAAIIYSPEHGPADGAGANRTIGTEELVTRDEPNRFVLELANLLRIAIL